MVIEVYEIKVVHYCHSISNYIVLIPHNIIYIVGFYSHLFMSELDDIEESHQGISVFKFWYIPGIYNIKCVEVISYE